MVDAGEVTGTVLANRHWCGRGGGGGEEILQLCLAACSLAQWRPLYQRSVFDGWCCLGTHLNAAEGEGIICNGAKRMAAAAISGPGSAKGSLLERQSQKRVLQSLGIAAHLCRVWRAAGGCPVASAQPLPVRRRGRQSAPLRGIQAKPPAVSHSNSLVSCGQEQGGGSGGGLQQRSTGSNAP